MDSGRTKPFDLGERTLLFAQRTVRFVDRVCYGVANVEIARQLVRSSGSVGANYIEAGESLGKKDFMMHIRICAKEAKESRYWLRLISCETVLESERESLIAEASELTRIFGAMIRNARLRQETEHLKRKHGNTLSGLE